MNGTTPAPADPGSGLDIFSKLFGQLNVPEILNIGNGLAFLSLLLAAVLISMSMVRGGTDQNTSLLIRRFLSVAVFFVITSIVGDLMRIAFAPSATQGPVTLRIAPLSMAEVGEKFPLMVVHNGQEKDIFDGPYEATLSSAQNFISVNAFDVATKLSKRALQISELLKAAEERRRETQPVSLPGSAVDFGAGG